MSPSPNEPRPVRWVVPAALFLAFAVVVYVFSAKVNRPSAPIEPPTAEGAPATGEIDDPIGRALRLAGIDSTRRNEWVEAIPGLDLASLEPAARERFVRIANTRRCDCGCGFTLAACRAFDSTCEESGPEAAALFDSVAAGHYAGVTGLRERPGAAPAVH